MMRFSGRIFPELTGIPKRPHRTTNADLGSEDTLMLLIKLDTRRITDWSTFHDLFAEAFGFPNSYGRNMSAWIDCMTCLDDPEAGLSTVHVSPGDMAVLELEHVDDFASRYPEQYATLIECASFVNWRRIQAGWTAVLALSFYKSN